jgi:hypothetical protein
MILQVDRVPGIGVPVQAGLDEVLPVHRDVLLPLDREVSPLFLHPFRRNEHDLIEVRFRIALGRQRPAQWVKAAHQAMNRLNLSLQQSILTLVASGWSGQRIVHELGVHRETVGKFLRGPFKTGHCAPRLGEPSGAKTSNSARRFRGGAEQPVRAMADANPTT